MSRQGRNPRQDWERERDAQNGYGEGWYNAGAGNHAFGDSEQQRRQHGGTYGASGPYGQSGFSQRHVDQSYAVTSSDRYGSEQQRNRFGGIAGYHDESDWQNRSIEGANQPRGRAPKGYTRSDERIREDVCERLEAAGLDASEVEVSVKEGEVTLTGTVLDRSSKLRMEAVADGVGGVKDVHNQIRLQRPGLDAQPTGKISH